MRRCKEASQVGAWVRTGWSNLSTACPMHRELTGRMLAFLCNTSPASVQERMFGRGPANSADASRGLQLHPPACTPFDIAGAHTCPLSAIPQKFSCTDFEALFTKCARCAAASASVTPLPARFLKKQCKGYRGAASGRGAAGYMRRREYMRTEVSGDGGQGKREQEQGSRGRQERGRGGAPLAGRRQGQPVAGATAEPTRKGEKN